MVSITRRMLNPPGGGTPLVFVELEAGGGGGGRRINLDVLEERKTVLLLPVLELRPSSPQHALEGP